MPECQRCKSKRVASVSSHASDMHNFSIDGENTCGYLPHDIGLGGGDDLWMSYCLTCGQIQGKFPLPLTKLEAQPEDDLIERDENGK